MRQFKSLTTALLETRKILVDRFERDLGESRDRHVFKPRIGGVDPETVLEVLTDVAVRHARDADVVRGKCDAVDMAAGRRPTSFDELVHLGLVRVVWGQAEWPGALHLTAGKLAPPLEAALRSFVQSRHDVDVELGDGARAALAASSDPQAQVVLNTPASSRAEALATWAAMARAPGWISLHLWAQSLGPDRLRWWLDRADFLEHGQHAPDEHWSFHELKSLCDAILDRLEAEGDLVGWPEERERVIRHFQVDRHRPLEPLAPEQIPLPEDFFGRLEWLGDAERADHAAFHHAREPLFGLVWYVVRAASRETYEAPNPLVRRLAQLAVERPALWTAMTWQLRRYPAVLVDLLMCRSAAAWTIDEIADWMVPTSGWDREAVELDARRRRFAAFRDAVEVGVHTLLTSTEKGPDDGAGFAWILCGCHRRDWTDSHGFSRETDGEREELWSRIFAEAAEYPEGVRRLLHEAAAYAKQRLVGEEFGGSWTRVAIELLSKAAPYLSEDDQDALAAAAVARYEAYLDADGQFEPTALPEALAAAFLAAVTLGSRFDLSPVARLRRAAVAAGDDYTKRHAARSRVRAHVRLLARGISGWPADDIPQRLVDALDDMLAIAIPDEPRRGRVGAFSANDEVSFNAGRTSLASDVGRALLRLSPAKRRPFVAALAQLKEPFAIASFARVLHANARSTLKRAAAAAVDAAPRVASLRETQARIELLLDARLFDEAERLLKKERNVRTLGPVPGREVWRFRMRLWLQLGRRRFKALLLEPIPSDLNQVDKLEAERARSFFTGLAELQRKGGSSDAAAKIFERLHAKSPEVSAYAVNLHAARLQALLPRDQEGAVPVEARPALAALMAEGERLMAPYRSSLRTKRDATYEGNRTLIRLALGQNEGVLEDLAQIPALLNTSANLWGYRVLALARLGRRDEAERELALGIEMFGRVKAMTGARAEIDRHGRWPSVQVEPVAERLSRVRDAIAAMKDLAPHDQAAAHGLESLHRFIVQHVRAACAGIGELVPILKKPSRAASRLSSSRSRRLPWEEGMNELLRRLLFAAVAPLGWSCHGEDPGGHTPGPKWGSRDCSIYKGTTPIAIIEALGVQEVPSARRAVVAHLRKLFAYSATCDLRILIVWSTVNDAAKVASIARAAAAGLRNALRVRGDPRDLRRPQGDGGPLGFVTLHGGAPGGVHLVHLIVDVAQAAQAAAARGLRTR